MTQNNGFESSTSLGLAGLNVVIEDENEYVFVPGDFDDDADDLLNNEEWDEDDDDDWTNCDLSPSLSCATSVATNVTLKDLNLIEDSAMMDIDEDANERTDVDAMDTEETRESKLAQLAIRKVNPKNGRRLSNKKLRKKIKMMKKAAAARAAAEALASQKAAADAAIMASSLESADTAVSDVPVSSSTSGRGAKSPKRKSHSSNVAVACAMEAIDTYRGEIEAGKRAQRKMRTVSIDIQG